MWKFKTNRGNIILFICIATKYIIYTNFHPYEKQLMNKNSNQTCWWSKFSG